MSGIAGIMHMDGRQVDGPSLRAMTDIIQHRGPDGSGHWINGPVGLGHMHMVATPESARESQPAVSADDNVVLTWDGRLDNRRELISTLRSTLAVSERSTDPDIVLAAYAAWGRSCPSRLIGDFAFGLWDAARQELLCARDPVGVRVLHYHFDGTRFIFGTEIKQLFTQPGISRELNEVMLGLYLSGSPRYGDLTFYKGIKRLPGGYSLVASRGGVATESYWNPDPANEIRYKDERQYTEHFREIFASSVQCRLKSAGPTGVLLSGGLDSSAVTSMAGRLRGDEAGQAPAMRAYNFTYADAPLDERPFVEQVVQDAGIGVEYIHVDDVWALKPAPGAAMRDEPFVLPFETLQHRALERMRSDGVRVALTGEGGDEAFSNGYMLYLRDWLLSGKLRTLWKDLKNATPQYRREAVKYMRRGILAGMARRVRRRTNGSIPPWIDPEFARRIQLSQRLDAVEVYRYRDTHYLQGRGFPPFFVGNDMRAAMYQVEMRHPFWDSRLVEFLVRIPPTIRVQGGRPKQLLKKAMVGVMPPEVLRRNPHGTFGPLVPLGLREQEADRLVGFALNSKLAELGAVNTERFYSVYDAYRQGDDSRLGRLLWSFVVEEWLRDARPFDRQAVANTSAGKALQDVGVLRPDHAKS
ncbi:MAG: asparagine synthase-related protein [Dehalococcoidia bacterium]